MSLLYRTMTFLFGRWIYFGLYNPVTDETVLPDDAPEQIKEQFRKHELQHKKDRKFGLLLVAVGVFTWALAGISIATSSITCLPLAIGSCLLIWTIGIAMHIRAKRAEKQL
jgi:hypothetical protein